MPYPPITALPDAPQRTDPASFAAKADAFVAALATFRTQLNAFGAYIDGVSLPSSFASGTAAVPSLGFTIDPDTGMYYYGANTIGWTAGGVNRMRMSTTALTSTLQMLSQDGTAAAPTYSFSADPDTGIYRVSANAIGFSLGGNERVRMSDSFMTINLPIIGTGITQSQLDLTAGRLMKVGDFGIGSGEAPVIGNASVTDGSIVPADYAYEATGGSSGGPFGGSVGGTLQHRRRTGTQGETQLFIARPDGYGMAHRSRTSGAWSEWAEVIDKRNLLGTVGFIGVYAAGAVMERGSNANGQYYKFANGFMICMLGGNRPSESITTSSVGGFISNSYVWTYPASFLAPPFVDAQIASAFSSRVGSYDEALANIYAASPTSQVTAAVRYQRLVAIGRWD